MSCYTQKNGDRYGIDRDHRLYDVIHPMYRQHLRGGDCLEAKTEDTENCGMLCDVGQLCTMTQVCVQLPTSADNVTLPAFAAAARLLLSAG